MDPGFTCRANIERFEQLLSGGSLNVAQTAIVTVLLEKELEALALLRRPSAPSRGSRPSSSG